jgi:hypothetical protein
VDSIGAKHWEELARRASEETDPHRLSQIINELLRALEQRERAAEGFGGELEQAS